MQGTTNVSIKNERSVIGAYKADNLNDPDAIYSKKEELRSAIKPFLISVEAQPGIAAGETFSLHDGFIVPAENRHEHEPRAIPSRAVDARIPRTTGSG